MNRKTEELEVELSPTANVARTAKFSGSGKIVIGEFCSIEEFVLLDTGASPSSEIVLGSRTRIKHGAVLRAYDGFIRIGHRVTIGEYSILSGHGGLLIDDAVIVAGHCYFTTANHIFDGNIPIRFQGETARGIRVKQGAWIGAACVILDEVTLGAGCVVGARSLVTHDLPSNTICFGSPCERVRVRRGENDVEW